MTPTTMAMTVSSRVTTMPFSTGVAKRYFPTIGHWNRPSRTPPRTTLEKNRVLTNMATSTRMTALATHRPGWRTGTVLVVPGPARPGVGPEAVESVIGRSAGLVAGADLVPSWWRR